MPLCRKTSVAEAKGNTQVALSRGERGSKGLDGSKWSPFYVSRHRLQIVTTYDKAADSFFLNIWNVLILIVDLKDRRLKLNTQSQWKW